ncbi:hypothetical protein MMC13_003313 [Lambiella insularis]|nr:hypothetical protein [Lambiella insularis]
MDRFDLIKMCPFELSDADKEVLSLKDEEFQLQTWEHLKQIIATKNLSILQRTPSDLANYIRWYSETITQYGGVANYVCRERLRWHSASASTGFAFQSAIPFAHPSDFQILRNDWPYGLTRDITHLVVWSKTPIAVTEDLGDPTQESQELIESFVNRTFRTEIPPSMKRPDQLMWFKNRVRWQSVKAIEHIHVIVRGAGEELLQKWTGQTAEDINARKWPKRMSLKQ